MATDKSGLRKLAPTRSLQALDANQSKAPMVGLEPRKSGIVIESREQKLASEAKTARIAGGVR